MAAIPKRQILSLYRSLLRESKKIPAYNFRMYALRKIRDDFRTNTKLTDPNALQTVYNDALNSLAIIKRQVIIGQLYSTDKLVIETLAK